MNDNDGDQYEPPKLVQYGDVVALTSQNGPPGNKKTGSQDWQKSGKPKGQFS